MIIIFYNNPFYKKLVSRNYHYKISIKIYLFFLKRYVRDHIDKIVHCQ